VLEVGTATGRFAVPLTCNGLEYTGVDLSRIMLRATRKRINQSVRLIQMDGCQLGFRSYFNYVLCIRTFHFLPKPVEALSGIYAALQPSGKCIVTFETDNILRRLVLFFGIGASEQYYYKISDVEDMFLKSGFKVVQSGSVMRIPVTLYRRCPRLLLPLLKQLERLWPWPMHDYVLGSK
jgi:ubiquinone/menaquinone biosynthesis C-methylase UbiE